MQTRLFIGTKSEFFKPRTIIKVSSAGARISTTDAIRNQEDATAE